MNATHLTDVQLTNLYLLQAIRLGIAQDRVSTCRKFGLDARQADYFAALSHDELWALVIHIGDSTLFPPRQDFLDLLELPPALLAPLAAVHAPRAPRLYLTPVPSRMA